MLLWEYETLLFLLEETLLIFLPSEITFWYFDLFKSHLINLVNHMIKLFCGKLKSSIGRNCWYFLWFDWKA